MSGHPAHLNEMLDLAELQLNDSISPEEFERLEKLLRADPSLRREYVRYCYLHAHLVATDAVVSKVYDEDQLRELAGGLEVADSPSDMPQGASAVGTQHGFGKSWLLASVTAVVLALALVIAFTATLPLFPPHEREVRNDSIAELTTVSNTVWTDTARAPRTGEQLGPGTLRLHSGRARVKFRNGAEVALNGPATFGVESESHASLFQGTVHALLAARDEPFFLQAGAVRVANRRGAELGVEVAADGTIEVHCLSGELQTQSRARLPRFYWNFDEIDKPLTEVMTAAIAKIGPDAQHTTGLVGAGAMSFNNRPGAYVNVGNGGGTQFGAGEFGVSSGLTIEALVVVRWSGDGLSNGKPLDYDEIFRKEDGPKRMLLSFQNDDGAHQRNEPPMDEFGPTLSFGLYLADDGYSELEAKLDGREAPTLDQLKQDGKPHHVVATYDSWTGVKAIYVDGVLCRQAQFPEGTLIEAGGPTDAIIGNVIRAGNEPFTGIIDEVAIYDFALSQAEIREHWNAAKAGNRYFPAEIASGSRQSAWTGKQTLSAGEAMRFDAKTGRSLGSIDIDYQRFRKN